jgi:DNA polymerase delta subunit 1
LSLLLLIFAEVTPQTNLSSCQLEVDCHYSSVIALPMDDPEWLGVAPLRIMSFDIECAGRKDVFPDPNIDPVIQIASVVKVARITDALIP